MSEASRPIKWTNVTNVICATILVGAETIGAGAASGWAIGGMFKLDPMLTNAMLALGGVGGLAVMIAFFRSAIRAEPFR